jgi:hypothetical protein
MEEGVKGEAGRRGGQGLGVRGWGLGAGDWGLGTGDWGLGTGDWGLGTGDWDDWGLLLLVETHCMRLSSVGIKKDSVGKEKETHAMRLYTICCFARVAGGS